MPILYCIDTFTGLINIKASGTYTVPLLIDHLNNLLGDPRFRKGMNSIFDLTGAVPDLACASKEFPRYHNIQRFIVYLESVQYRRGAARVGIVAPDDLNYGIARMFCSLSEHLIGQRHAFRERSEAESWIHNEVAADAEVE